MAECGGERYGEAAFIDEHPVLDERRWLQRLKTDVRIEGIRAELVAGQVAGTEKDGAVDARRDRILLPRDDRVKGGAAACRGCRSRKAG